MAAAATPPAVPDCANGTTVRRDSDFYRLIKDHLPLAQSITDQIKRRLPANVDEEELRSVALTGLVAAARNFRPEESSSFAGYASSRIRGAILDELGRMDFLTRSTRAKAKLLQDAVSRLETAEGKTVDQPRLGAELRLTPAELAKWMDQARPVKFVSLDVTSEHPGTGEHSLHELIPDDCSVTAIEALERKELAQQVADRLTELPGPIRRMLAMYYYEGMKLAEIARVLGQTESRVCQIRTQAVNRLRVFLLARLN
jgi:RNA polymerase sigma factor for flagellar operon FliA